MPVSEQSDEDIITQVVTWDGEVVRTIQRRELGDELRSLLNRYSAEGGSGTPDFLLAEYLLDSLDTFNRITRQRDGWWNFKPMIGGTVPAVNVQPGG